MFPTHSVAATLAQSDTLFGSRVITGMCAGAFFVNSASGHNLWVQLHVHKQVQRSEHETSLEADFVFVLTKTQQRLVLKDQGTWHNCTGAIKQQGKHYTIDVSALPAFAVLITTQQPALQMHQRLAHIRQGKEDG